MERDGSFADFGPEPSAIHLLIAAILCAELEEWPQEPRDDFYMAKEVKDKAERYALYLSLFFTVSRRHKRPSTCTKNHTASKAIADGLQIEIDLRANLGRAVVALRKIAGMAHASYCDPHEGPSSNPELAYEECVCPKGIARTTLAAITETERWENHPSGSVARFRGKGGSREDRAPSPEGSAAR